MNSQVVQGCIPGFTDVAEVRRHADIFHPSYTFLMLPFGRELLLIHAACPLVLTVPTGYYLGMQQR